MSKKRTRVETLEAYKQLERHVEESSHDNEAIGEHVGEMIRIVKELDAIYTEVLGADGVKSVIEKGESELREKSVALLQTSAPTEPMIVNVIDLGIKYHLSTIDLEKKYTTLSFEFLTVIRELQASLQGITSKHHDGGLGDKFHSVNEFNGTLSLVEAMVMQHLDESGVHGDALPEPLEQIIKTLRDSMTPVYTNKDEELRNSHHLHTINAITFRVAALRLDGFLHQTIVARRTCMYRIHSFIVEFNSLLNILYDNWPNWPAADHRIHKESHSRAHM